MPQVQVPAETASSAPSCGSLPTTAGPAPHRTAKPTALHAPTQGFRGGPIDEYEIPQRSISLSTEFLHARTTTSLAELAESWQARVRTAHALAVDILGHFAVADALVLRADGDFNTAVVNSEQAAQITEWTDNQPAS